MASWMRITGYVLSPEDLYDYVRLEDIDSYNEDSRNGTDPDYFGGWTIRLYASGVKYDG